MPPVLHVPAAPAQSARDRCSGTKVKRQRITGAVERHRIEQVVIRDTDHRGTRHQRAAGVQQHRHERGERDRDRRVGIRVGRRLPSPRDSVVDPQLAVAQHDPGVGLRDRNDVVDTGAVGIRKPMNSSSRSTLGPRCSRARQDRSAADTWIRKSLTAWRHRRHCGSGDRRSLGRSGSAVQQRGRRRITAAFS